MICNLCPRRCGAPRTQREGQGYCRMGTLPMVARDAYPQIISHRGASGYIPEHSLQAYQTAINLLTDYIEPDLCLSKDG